jgi:outer membrane protein TolC
MAAALALCGCATPTTSPRQRVPLDVPPAWSSPFIGLTDATTPLAQWWLRFSDATLTDLVSQAHSANTDIAITRWRNQAGLVGAVEVEQAVVAAGHTRAQRPATTQRPRAASGSRPGTGHTQR